MTAEGNATDGTQFSRTNELTDVWFHPESVRTFPVP